MHEKIGSEIQIIFIILAAAITLILLSIIIGGNVQPYTVTAQEPIESTLPSISIDAETLGAFGLPTNIIHASNVLTFDLEVVKTTDVITVDSGTLVTFTISIANHGPNNANGVIFYDNLPKQMKNVVYTFTQGAGAIDNGASQPEDLMWFLTNPIPISNSIVVTVTGELTSAYSITVTNTAMITTYNPYAETGVRANSASASVGIEGYNPDASGPIYLPIVQRFPTPTPVPILLAYHETFGGSDSWPEPDSGGCKREVRSNQYWVDLDRDRSCLPPAKDTNKPESPYRTYGEFEVVAYVSGEDKDSGTAFGIFINGAGGDDYYLFRIWPNKSGCSSGGKWELRRWKSGNESWLIGENCDSAITRGYGWASRNTLRVAHTSARKLSVYVNGTLLDSYTDNTSEHRTGKATGVYVLSDDKHARIKFDDFKVYKYP